jgi:GNAT superfamily N-acetyltransferase
VTMFEYFVLAYYMVREAIATGELKDLLRRQISRNRLNTPVELDLSAPLPAGGLPANSDFQFVELRPDDLRTGKWIFSVRSRGVKALLKINKRIRGFALVRGTTVVADLWCVFSSGDGKPVSHPDLKMLGITCGKGEAYTFDMLIDPAYRGKNLAGCLQRSLHKILKEEGYLKVYGSFYNDNVPALWMHRMLKFRELPKMRVSRFFFLARGKKILPGGVNKKGGIFDEGF